MSSAERFVRHSKLQTDRAIGEAYSRLAQDSRALTAFTELLQCVRVRSPGLFEAPLIGARHLGVEALCNLSRFSDAHVRPIAAWRGSDASWQGTAASLAQHLVGRYNVPRFLAAAWYATNEDDAERQRRWFIAHASGLSFRSLDLPVPMTRRMEHIFLRTPAHVSIEHALRIAELAGLGAPDDLVYAVLATRQGADLSNGAFWRTMWLLLVANWAGIGPAQAGPLIDFVQAIRHERVAVEAAHGLVMREPPQPTFALKGRTAASMLRLMDDWHRGLGTVSGGLSWTPSNLGPLVVEDAGQEPSGPPVSWHMTELTNSAQLRAEGVALQHCVASYGDRCWRGFSQIWSLRLRTGCSVRSILTVEVDPRRQAIIQARGFRNQPASGKALRILATWAAREDLRLMF